MVLLNEPSLSNATTAVANQHTAYPSTEELSTFKLPLEDKTSESKGDSVFHNSDHDGKPHCHPETPIPPSPASTEASDHQIADDTPSTIRGKSMFSPQHPLSSRHPSSSFNKTTPRWPFQDATPRGPLMALNARSATDSSGRFNSTNLTGPRGNFSASESLDEFQLNHPNARALALHPPGLTGSDTSRNLVSVPESAHIPFRPARHAESIPPARKKHFAGLFRRRRHGKRSSTAKPRTFWFQRIATYDDFFFSATVCTCVFAVNFILSFAMVLSFMALKIHTPPGMLMWLFGSTLTFVFTVTVYFFMHKFRRNVKRDEENRGRSTRPKDCVESERRLPAHPFEIAHRRGLGAADRQAEQSIQQSSATGHGPEEIELRDMSSVNSPVQGPVLARGDSSTQLQAQGLPRQNTNEQMDNYWTDVSIMPSSRSNASSITAVVASAPAVPTHVPGSNR